MARRMVEVRKPRDIGDAIRVAREARGISQEELAEENAYDRFYLNRLETGRSTVYITRLLRTLKSLGITLSVTFDDGRSDGGKGSLDD
jgi:HTH-type transcriptional regulator/antitoxin HipB